jgi:Protein of unknown function (DUF1579)
MARTSSGTISPPKPTPSAEHKRLAMFVGDWNVAGRQVASRVGPAAEIAGTERFEWLAGDFFLVHHFDCRVGADLAACIEVTGYDPVTRSYPTHTYYNNGQSAEWQMTEQDDAWIITGEWPMEGGTAQVRCTVEFGDEGNSRTGKWESSSDGANWETFWEVRATRA